MQTTAEALANLERITDSPLFVTLGRIFTEVKQRPHYFVSRVTRSRANGADEPGA